MSLTLMLNLAGRGFLRSKMVCVALSLGKSSLTDTKHAFIRLTVHIFSTSECICQTQHLILPPGELPKSVFVYFHQSCDDDASIDAISD